MSQESKLTTAVLDLQHALDNCPYSPKKWTTEYNVNEDTVRSKQVLKQLDNNAYYSFVDNDDIPLRLTIPVCVDTSRHGTMLKASPGFNLPPRSVRTKPDYDLATTLNIALL